MLYYHDPILSYQPWTGTPLPDPETGAMISWSPQIERAWSAEKLAEWRLYSPVNPPVPENKRILNTSVGLVDGVVSYIYDTEDAVVELHDLYEERDRRLSAGFDFDFGGARGVHRINTTTGDMIGWDEVGKFAQALLNLGQLEQTITIATGTGVAQITPVEWQMVMLAAAQFRQPIWGASFLIEQMNPIPFDFRNDAYWELSNGPA